ncbi:MAG: hypothetical protein JW891_09420 [Candidatus Lokiarchaeota archaeon]|nr:hypothetical protein [Candidatus Lokiarchaeota archaeon]
MVESSEIDGIMIEARDKEGNIDRRPVLFTETEIVGIARKFGGNKIIWMELGRYRILIVIILLIFKQPSYFLLKKKLYHDFNV